MLKAIKSDAELYLVLHFGVFKTPLEVEEIQNKSYTLKQLICSNDFEFIFFNFKLN